MVISKPSICEPFCDLSVIVKTNNPHIPVTTSQPAVYTPGILSVLPLFYVGWSDSVLSPTEMRFIHQKLEGMVFLTQTRR